MEELARVDIRVLGPAEVVLDGRAVDLPAPKERALLGFLALQPGRPAGVDDLMAALDDGGAGSGRKGMQVRLSRLRRRFDEAGIDGASLIATRGDAYVLDVEGGQVDVARFEEGISQARVVLRSDPQAAAARLDGALALWRASPLPELADTARGQAEIARLQELRLVATELRTDAGLALGEHQDLVARLEAMVVAEPLRERLWAQLMLALYRSGRQADALRAYQRARTLLVEELGIEPGAELRDLEAAMIAQDPKLDRRADPASDVLTGGSSLGEDYHLRWIDRHLQHRLIGRTGERDRLIDAWNRARSLPMAGFVSITGVAGVGKSRLLAEVADQARRDGALLVCGRCVPGVGLSGLGDAGVPLGISPVEASATDSAAASRAALEFARAVGVRLERELMHRPVLITVDDGQWADTVTVNALRSLTDRPIPLPEPWAVLTVVAYRDDAELPHGGPDLLAMFQQLRVRDRIRLAGLAPEEAAELLAIRLGWPREAAADDALAAIGRDAGGIAAYLFALAAHLVDTGKVVPGEPGWQGAPPAGLAEVGLPDPLVELVARRLEQQQDDVVALLTASSLVANEFDIATAARAAAVDESTALDLLDRAAVARLVTETPSGTFTIATEVERLVLLGRLSAARRSVIERRLHEA